MGYIYDSTNSIFNPTDYEPTKYKIYYNPNARDYSTTLEELKEYTTGTYLTNIHVFGILCDDGYGLKKPSTLYRAGIVTSSTGSPSRWESGQSSESIDLDDTHFKFLAFYIDFTKQSVAIDWGRIKRNLEIMSVADFTLLITGMIGGATFNHTDGETIKSGSTITLTIQADSGKWFTENQYTFKKGDEGTVINIVKFTISPDRYTLTWSGVVDGNITLDEMYIATSYAKSNIGIYTHIFRLSDDNLNGITNICFKEVTKTEYPELKITESSNNQYLMKLYKIPFDVSTLVKEQNGIYLGAINTTINADEISDYKLEVNGGKISVPLKYNNVYDYLNADARMYLPYVGFINLDIKYVIGANLSIKYIYNLLTGNCSIYVLTGDIPIYTNNKNICYDLPIYQSAYSKVEDDFNFTVMEIIDTAFIEITRNKPYDNSGIFGKNRIFYSKLNELTGYHVINDIQLNNSVPYEMQERIRNVLQGGIFL